MDLSAAVDTLLPGPDGTLDRVSLAAQQLVQLANDSGGRDNISVILVRILEDFAVPTGWFAKFKAWFR